MRIYEFIRKSYILRKIIRVQWSNSTQKMDKFSKFDIYSKNDENNIKFYAIY